MHIAQQIRAQFGTPTIRGVRPGRARPQATVLLGGVLLAGVTLLTACGGGSDITQPPPPPDNPIPEKVYEVITSSPRNNCGVADISSFAFFVRPHAITAASYELSQLFNTPVPANFLDDRLTLSVPIQLDSGVVTFSGDWTFSTDRQSFSGTTSFDVRPLSYAPCTFTFASAGTVAVVPGDPVAPTGASASGAEISAQIDHRAGVQPAVAADVSSDLGWGLIGDVFIQPNELQCPSSSDQHPLLFVGPPIAHARNMDPHSGEGDLVFFRFQIYGSYSSEGADAIVLANISEFEPLPEAIVYTSRWYQQQVVDVDAFSSGAGPLFNFDIVNVSAEWEDNAGTTWPNTDQNPISLTSPGYYVLVEDVFWAARPNQPLGWFSDRPSYGWRRAPVGPICHRD